MSDLSISKAWEESKQVLERDAKLFTAVALAMVTLPITVGSFFAPAMTLGQPIKFSPWMLASLLLLLVAIAGVLAMSTLAIEHGVRVGDAVQRGFRRLLPFCAVTIGLLLLLSIVGGVVAAAAGSTSPVFAMEILLLLFLLLSPLLARFSITAGVAAAEDGGPVHLVARSWALSRGAVLKLWGVVILLCIAGMVLELTAGAIFGSLLTVLLGPIDPGSASKLVFAAIFGLLRAVEFLLFAVVMARIYVQLVGRRSGI
jgi:hypothetical protein